MRAFCLTVLVAFAVLARGAAAAEDAPWLQVDIGLIGTASEDVLASALERVHEQGYAGLILRLDTPGGSLDATRTMVKAMLGSDVPIVVWVGPAGSRAGSAGAFLTLAANVAAMAPGTNIGASHPVEGTGRNVEDGSGSEMERKVTNDTVAFIEGIAKTRGRNVEMARSFVATSVSITDEEALTNKVIDLRAQDLDELMAKLDGRSVEVQPGKTLILHTKTAGGSLVQRVVLEPTLRQRLLGILSNPNLFYLLFMAGLIGLSYELTHPGLFFPGVAGAICLILALISMSILPISYGAAALLLAGIAMMVAEAFVPSFGTLGIGGLVAFVLGSVFLVDPSNKEGLRISWLVIAPGAATVAAAFLALGFLILRSRRAPVRSGREGLVGQTAETLADFTGGVGDVRAAGAIWRARLAPEAATHEVRRGDRLRILAVDGLELIVTKP